MAQPLPSSGEEGQGWLAKLSGEGEWLHLLFSTEIQNIVRIAWRFIFFLLTLSRALGALHLVSSIFSDELQH